MKLEMVGKWAFIVGLVLAVVVGYFFQAEWVVWVLAILGVIVGLLNVTREDAKLSAGCDCVWSFRNGAKYRACSRRSDYGHPEVCGSLRRRSDGRGRIESAVRDRPVIVLAANSPKLQKQVASCRCSR
jgi:hypothetical protein